MKDVEVSTVTDDDGNKYKLISINKGLEAIDAALQIIESHYMDYHRTNNQQSLDTAFKAVSVLFGRQHENNQG